MKPAATGLSTIQFDTRRDLKIGAVATNVALADLDGDGRKDLVINRYQDSKLTFVHSLGGGSYSAGVDLPAGPLFPFGLAAADLNGDGRADVISTDYDNAQIYIYENAGAGNFNNPGQFATVESPIGLAAADLDLDGLIDIAAGSISTDEIRVHRGIGSLAFDGGAPFAIGGLPVQLYTTDIDEDGRPDVICSDIMASRLRLLRNAPSTSNTSGIDLEAFSDAGTAPALLGLAMGDLDGDHRPEFVTSSASVPSIAVWKLNGRNLQQIATVPNPAVTGAIVLNDFDGDGKLDLAAACPFGNGVELWHGIGGGLFGSPIFRATGQGPVFLAADDTTGDGVADLHVAAALSGEVTIMGGRFGASSNMVEGPPAIFLGGQPILGASGDLDGDGANDLAIGDNANPIVNVLRNIHNLQFEPLAALPVHALASAWTPLLLDFNNDGALDIAALSDSGATFYNNSGIGVFTETGFEAVTGGLILGEAVDLYHDGWMDFAATAPSAGAVATFRNLHGSFALAQMAPTGLSPLGVDAGDFDRDGDLDLAVINNGDNTIRVLKQKESTFVAQSQLLGTLAGPAYLYARDFNNDGRADLAASHLNASDILLFTANGKMRFDAPSAVATNGESVAFSAGDINQDGRADLLYNENTTGRGAVRLAGKNGVFGSPTTTFAGQYGVTSIVLSDLDGDELPEVLTISSFSGLMEIHKNLSLK